jgi:pilus assembly protein Flp/PilA
VETRSVYHATSGTNDSLNSSKKKVIQMRSIVIKFVRDERGLTTVEYAVAGGLIALAVVGAFQALGATVGGVINGINAVLP